VLKPDATQLLPPPRAQIRAQPLVGGDRVLAEAVRLITTEGARRDGWVYVANWYAAHTFDSPLDPEHRVADPSRWLGPALSTCVAAGARVRVLLWSGSLRALDPVIAGVVAPLAPPVLVPLLTAKIRKALVARFTNYDVNRATVDFVNGLARPRTDVAARLDDATLLFGSHHQKLLVVGNNHRTTAIVGGVDWHANRIATGTKAYGISNYDGTPYFDVSLRVDGEAAEDVADLFELRWRADRERRKINLAQRKRPRATRPPSGATVQIAPNFGCGAPLTDRRSAIRGADALIANLFNNCRRFFYAEDQYGVGNDSLERAVKQAFANGAQYGVVVLANALLVSDIPEIEYHRYRFWTKFPQLGRRLFVFERLGDNSIAGGPHAYVHSKLVLVDDEAASIASVNMNRRSWFHDSELAAVIADAPRVIKDLRLRIWREHLTLRAGVDIDDAMRAGDTWRRAYTGTLPMLRLKPVSFRSRPLRLSADVHSGGGPATQLVGKVVGIGLGSIGTFAVEQTVDAVMDAAYDRLIDPKGPDRC
jgi:phosphatidylserine/phosphatidylglycerophosphate/cardiolipin synthase-like enzyme